jgi:hypothetical protein
MNRIKQSTIVEPNAGYSTEEKLNPTGRAYYAFSTLLSTPASLSQDVGLALGAQAGRSAAWSEEKQEDDGQNREMAGREQLRDHRYVPGLTTSA